MKDPRFHFQKKYRINPTGLLNFYFIESLKLNGRKQKGIMKNTWEYAKNVYNLDIGYFALYAFIQRYKKFMKWLSKDKPVDIYE